MLEKVNDIYRQVSVSTLDEVGTMRKPTKLDIEGCSIFCRFINAFRDPSQQWDIDSLL